jgi:hypothetical protein
MKLIEKDLCALRLLFSSSCLNPPGIKREMDLDCPKNREIRREPGGRRGEPISAEWYAFSVLSKKNSAVSACSAVRFFFIAGGP